MSEHNGQRNSEEIEKDINQSRSRLDSTLHEIEERFSPQQMLNTSYEYLRHGGANEFFANLGTNIKQNPLPFLVTSAGLGWMMLSQRYPQQGHHQARHSTPGIAVHEGTHPDGHGAAGSSHPGEVPATAYRSAATSNAASAGSENAGNGGSGRLKGMAEGAKDKAHHLGDRAKETRHHLGEKAHHMSDSVRDTSSHLQHGAQSSLHDMSDRARQVRGQSSDFIQDHPLVVGALGFALGAALGGIFPATKKEDEYMGEYRDRVMHKAAETGQAQVDKAQHTIHDKVEAYKGEANHAPRSNVSEPQNSGAAPTGSPTPFAEPHSAESNHSENENQRPGTSSPERHSSGLTGSSTPSGNTQGSGTNRTP